MKKPNNLTLCCFTQQVVAVTRLTLDRQTNPGQIETTMAQSSLSNTFTHSKLITHINNDPYLRSKPSSHLAPVHLSRFRHFRAFVSVSFCFISDVLLRQTTAARTSRGVLTPFARPSMVHNCPYCKDHAVPKRRQIMCDPCRPRTTSASC